MKRALIVPVAAAVFLAGCRQDMHDQPKYEALAASALFADGRAARLPVEGTVARGQLKLDEKLHTGKQAGKLVEEMPVAVTRATLERGRERYNIFCAPCHGLAGVGDGVIVERGFRPPPSYHIDRLREQPAGYFFDVVTSGFGAMPSYATRIPVNDRWAIVAYVRALQLSQYATLEDVPAAEKKGLEEKKK